jgi:general stress protein 26
MRPEPKFKPLDKVRACKKDGCNGFGYYYPSTNRYAAVNGVANRVYQVMATYWHEDRNEWYYGLAIRPNASMVIIAEHALSLHADIELIMKALDKLENKLQIQSP